MERYLIVYGRSEAKTTLYALRVCTAQEWAILKDYGWYIVAKDPDPNRPVPWENDAA